MPPSFGRGGEGAIKGFGRLNLNALIAGHHQALHAVSTYKGLVIRDTFWRLVKFLGKISDRLIHINN